MGCGASKSLKPDGADERVAEPAELSKPASGPAVVTSLQRKNLQAPPVAEEKEGEEENWEAQEQAPSSETKATNGNDNENRTSVSGADSGGNSSIGGNGFHDQHLNSFLDKNAPSGRGAQSNSMRGSEANLMGLDNSSTSPFADLLDDHGRFLTYFVAVLDRNSGIARGGPNKKKATEAVSKPKLEMRQFKSHTMDNVRVRKMCDELMHLEDPSHPIPEDAGKSNKGWMKTLQISVGKHVNSVKINNNPEITIGGYFLISQMLSYIRGLVALDVSSNDLKAAEARVLGLGLRTNKSVQELRMRDNSIGSEGATSMAEMLKVNNTLLFIDLRSNNVRGAGICVLADAVSDNHSLTDLDMRWNYAGECSDFVELALLDLKKFCYRNMLAAMDDYQAKKKQSSENSSEVRNETESPRLSEAVTEVQENVAPALRVEVNSNGKEASPHIGDSHQHSFTTSPFDGNQSLNGHFSDEPKGRLEVTILSAKNLPQVIWTAGKDGEFLGLPQAYCIFTLNKQTTQTVIMKKDWNPFWNYTFTMDVREVWQVCTLKVMHSKSLTKTHRDDYSIGNVNLPVGAIINWRGVSRGSDRTWRAYHRPLQSGPGTIYKACRGKDKQGSDTDAFETAEEAARAYDEVASKKDGEKAMLNFSGDGDYIGQHVKEESFSLSGEDGISVIGVQAGVNSTVRLRLKFFSAKCNYLEIHLDKASSLPKMDAGLGSCDAYCIVIIGDYRFRSRVVRNSLDPEFNQTFRLAITDGAQEMELKTQLWDWDRFDEDDHMGDAIVSISPKETANAAKDGKFRFKAAEATSKGDGNEYVKNGKGDMSHLHLRFSYSVASEQVVSF